MEYLDILLLVVAGILFLRSFWLFGRDCNKAASLTTVIMLVMGILSTVFKFLSPYVIMAGFGSSITTEFFRLKEVHENKKFERTVSILFIMLALISIGIEIGSSF